MNHNSKIIASALISVIVISSLFFVVPITAAFIISYAFALIAIACIVLSLCMFGKKETTKAPQGHSFVYTAVVYSIVSVIFSIISCVADLSAAWTVVPHIAILAFFIIRIIALTAGSQYINKVGEKVEIKHKDFQKEKENYWK